MIQFLLSLLRWMTRNTKPRVEHRPTQRPTEKHPKPIRAPKRPNTSIKQQGRKNRPRPEHRSGPSAWAQKPIITKSVKESGRGAQGNCRFCGRRAIPGDTVCYDCQR